MWAEGKVRIIDIANSLGVSTATVSNVLHGRTRKISDATVRRVQQALEESGYIPNMAATLLAQNDSRIIGVVIKDHEKYEGKLFSDPFISSSLNYLSEEIEKSGRFMMVKKANGIMEAARFASMWNMDGMVLLSFCADEYQHLRDCIRIPFVVYDGSFENSSRISNIRIDDRDGGRQVGHHLRALGHTDVLCVADNFVCMDRARYEGLCEGLGAPAQLLQVPMHREERTSFYTAHLAQLRRPTAIFAASDYYAADLLRFLQKNGLRVPRDVSLAGFDDTELCTLVSPALTSVRQDAPRRAAQAIRLLEAMKQDPSFSQDILLPVTLVVRESTAGLRH